MGDAILSGRSGVVRRKYVEVVVGMISKRERRSKRMVFIQDPTTPSHKTRKNVVAVRFAKKIARTRRKKMKDVRPTDAEKSDACVTNVCLHVLI